jgi:hypothetical protein
MDQSQDIGRARIGLGLLSVLSIGPPVLHFCGIIRVLDSARIMGGLLPAPLLFLRFFGPASALLAFVVLAAFVSALFRGQLAHSLFRRCTAVLLVFSTVYLCYTLFAIFFLLATGTV